ncbi:MAG: hypothetical protein AB7H93_12170 [Vicinamibacterales bacterium]
MIAVVFVDEAQRSIAEAFLPATNWRADGGGRVYWAYKVDRAEALVFQDDLSGRPLVEVRAFDTIKEARDWVLADMRQRAPFPVSRRVQ